jgi:hypothetical protein
MNLCPHCKSPTRICPPQSNLYKYHCGTNVELDVNGNFVEENRSKQCFENEIQQLKNKIDDLEISIESLIKS